MSDIIKYAEQQLNIALKRFEDSLFKSGPNGHSPFIADYPVNEWVIKMNEQSARIRKLEAVAEAANTLTAMTYGSTFDLVSVDRDYFEALDKTLAALESEG